MEEIIRIAKRMKDQDNYATADPIYIVREKQRIYGIDSGWTDDEVWLNEDGSEVSEDDPDLADVLEYYVEHGTEPKGWTLAGYRDQYINVQYFFSADGAMDYIESNKHNLNKPHIYVDSAHRNPEWKAIRDFLNKVEKERKSLSEAYSHLGAALAQSIDTDDGIIMGHVKDAYAILRKSI